MSLKRKQKRHKQKQQRKRQMELEKSPLPSLLQEGIDSFHQGKYEDAENTYKKVLMQAPDYDQALHALAVLYLHRSWPGQAVPLLQKAISLNPTDPLYYSNLGTALLQTGHAKEAVSCYQNSIELDADYVSAYNNLAFAYDAMGEYGREVSVLKQGLERKPGNGKLLNELVKTLTLLCAWQECTPYTVELLQQPLSISPYHSLCLPIEQQTQLEIAQHYAKQLRTRQNFAPERNRRKTKLRLGYVCADFREHPTAHLILQLFALHNRDEFEVYAYSLGEDDGSQYRKALAQTCDKFIDMRNENSEAVARRMHDDGIDIAFDLMGYIQNAKPEIFAQRPAPVQINYLAYPGTMGASFIDYTIVDRHAVPRSNERYYSEHLICMPDSYFIADNNQTIAKPESRTAYGLPEQGFVFCCFNKANKIDQEVFDVWLELLDEVPGSVLWLYAPEESVRKSLRDYALSKDVPVHSLVFASRVPKANHLARYQIADLFLDCFNVSAHTTAIDALWAGLPILVYEGGRQINRASSSIVRAAGLKELVTIDKASYKAKALHYAKDPEALAALKERLANEVRKSPLFDTAGYVKNLETALWQAWKQDEPYSFEVSV